VAPRWQPGDSVLWRGGVEERVRWAIPHNFVGQRHGRVMLYCRPGARGKRPKHAFADYPQQLASGEWDIVDFAWKLNHVLRLTPVGRAHSIDLFWAAPSWEFRGWYVNLQAPLRRSPLGFDTRDHALDITVEPDGAWAWKDEDHLAQAVDLGLFTPDEAVEIRAEGERVLAEQPWPTGWEDWRPDSHWPIPTLPSGWEHW
jgi:hypothetical protein